MNLSAPAPANLTAPVVSHLLVPSNSGNSPVETLFQSLYGSLAGFENGAEQGGAEQQSTLKNAPAKKDPGDGAAGNSPLPPALLTGIRTIASPPLLLASAVVQVMQAAESQPDSPAAQTAALTVNDEQQTGVGAGTADSSAEQPAISQRSASPIDMRTLPPAASLPVTGQATLPQFRLPLSVPASLPINVQVSTLPPVPVVATGTTLLPGETNNVPLPNTLLKTAQAGRLPAKSGNAPAPAESLPLQMTGSRAPSLATRTSDAAPPPVHAQSGELLPDKGRTAARQASEPATLLRDTPTESSAPQPALTPAPVPTPEDSVVAGVTSAAPVAATGSAAPVTANSAEPAPANPTPPAAPLQLKAAPTAIVSPVQPSAQDAASPVVPMGSPEPAPSAAASSGQPAEVQAKQPRDPSSPRATATPTQIPVPPAPAPAPPASAWSGKSAQDDDETRNAAQLSQPPTAGNALLVATTPAVPVAPRTENLAFTLQMTHTDVLPPRAPVSQPKLMGAEPAPMPARQPDSNIVPREPQPNPALEASSDGRASAYADLLRKNPTPETGLHWADSLSVQRSDIRAAAVPSDTPEPASAGPASQVPELHAQLETPAQPPLNQEILLQVSGGDQSTASIRIADRAGTVNISVHASDPELRDSLRSNLGDLSSQLNTQGWKTEVSRPVPVAAHADNTRDSHSEGERSFSQQQQSPGGRQQGRERRAGAGRWRDEFEEQVSSQPASSGGKS